MKVLIVIDVQNDFCPGGALAVKEGDAIVPVVNQAMSRFDLIVATQDWHPPSHASFAANHAGKAPGETVRVDGIDQILWPTHCVQGTRGAELHPDLDAAAIERVFRKGADPRLDSYSCFFDNAHRRETGLREFLETLPGEVELFLCGLATDYCVKFSALDAVALGFKTCLVLDACRGVNLRPDDVDKAVAEMAAAGVTAVTSEHLH